jgi:hypothetical protein
MAFDRSPGVQRDQPESARSGGDGLVDVLGRGRADGFCGLAGRWVGPLDLVAAAFAEVAVSELVYGTAASH